ncbi:MAG: hypothetical protein IMZ61_03955, partial [Planctomycetes bacterium]|nr:hypothetical protein [Planctomycetota bacterium]
MISRKATITLAELYDTSFSGRVKKAGVRLSHYELKKVKLYDFLYEQDYEAWFLNQIKALRETNERALSEFIMKLHTGESIVNATPDWSWEERKRLGQLLLIELAEN